VPVFSFFAGTHTPGIIIITSVSETIRKPPLVKAYTALKTKKNKIGAKRFSIWRMEFLHLLQCGTITTLISSDDCTLQCGMWLWNHNSEFTKWQHPAMWYVGSGMTCHWIRPNFRHIGILHLVSISTPHRSRHGHSVPVCDILSKSNHTRQKKMTLLSIFNMPYLSHLRL